MINKSLKFLILLFGLEFNITQYKQGRKLFGGVWFKNYNQVTNPFWSIEEHSSCGGRTIRTEIYL